jgi:hypothetical protein
MALEIGIGKSVPTFSGVVKRRSLWWSQFKWKNRPEKPLGLAARLKGVMATVPQTDTGE